MDPIQSIFHEKQEGSLCAQHCLNALLQGHYFTAVDLAEIAQQLDERERQHMAEAGEQTEEYRRFMQQPSSNFDDSGFFSVQVIASALRVWNLELLPFNSQNEISVQARADPTQQKAFICNFREHWFSVRKIGFQWFNVNSLLSGPELISDTYLAMFLTQLQQEGYALFLIIGDLPGCDADEILKAIPAEQRIKPRLITEKQASTSTPSGETTTGSGQDDQALQLALEQSRDLVESDDKVLQRTLELSRAADEEKMLQRALQMSMEEGASNSTSTSTEQSEQRLSGTEEPSTSSASLSAEDLRRKRLAYLDKKTDADQSESSGNTSNNAETTSSDAEIGTGQQTEEDLLQEAIQMSMAQP